MSCVEFGSYLPLQSQMRETERRQAASEKKEGQKFGGNEKIVLPLQSLLRAAQGEKS